MNAPEPSLQCPSIESVDELPPGGWEQWVIYDHPRDHPEYWVVRRWTLLPKRLCAERVAALFKELERARAWIHQERPGFSLIQPAGADPDSVVYEVWG